MDRKRILLAEGEKIIVARLCAALTGARYAVDVALTAGAGKLFFDHNTYDLVLADVTLPDINGCDFCQYIRERDSYVPLLMFSSGDPDLKMEGFQAGADDYIVIADDLRELLLRIKALTRRFCRPVEREKRIRAADIVIDLDSKEVRRNERVILLSSKEFLLLQLLVVNKNKIVSRKEIIYAVWGKDLCSKGGRVSAFINSLRRKIEEDPCQKCIYTVTGKGYFLAEKTQ